MNRKIIYFVLTILLLDSSQCFAQAELEKVRINDYSGGMVTNALADILSPNQAVLSSNVEVSRKGTITKRKGQTLFASDLNSAPFTGIGRFDPDPSTSYMVAASGASIVSAASTNSRWITINTASPFSVGYNTEFIQANDLLFILNGRDNTAWWDGLRYTQGNGWGNASPPVGYTAAWVRNYLMISGSPGFESWIYISNNLQPRIFSPTDIIKVNTGDGQAIQHLEAFRLNEVVVYRDRSIYLLDVTGSPPSTCTTDCWTVQPISNAVGLAAKRAVVSLGNDQWFLSSEPIAVRSLVRSDLDKILIGSVSEQIDDIFNGTGSIVINRNMVYKACAVLFNNKFFLAIPTGNSTINNTVVVYDFNVKAWTTISNWFVEDWQLLNNNLYFDDARVSRVYQVFSGTSGDYSASQVSIVRSTSQALPIPFFYISKAIDFDQPENFKSLDSVEIEMLATGNNTATVSINLDNSGWYDVGTMNLSGNSVTTPITLPFTLDEQGVARKTFQLQQYGEFKKIQVKVRQEGLGELAGLQRITVFARVRPWRRE